MTSVPPWWAVPAASVATVLLTLTWTTVAEQLRLRLARAKQWDPQKMEIYRSYWDASVYLLDLAVWPTDRTVTPAPSQPLTEEIRRLYRAVVMAGPETVARTAHQVAERAAAFAAAVEDIRRTTMRGAQGALAEEARDRYRRARADFAAAIDEFALASRRDLHVSDSYQPLRSLTENSRDAE